MCLTATQLHHCISCWLSIFTVLRVVTRSRSDYYVVLARFHLIIVEKFLYVGFDKFLDVGFLPHDWYLR